MPEIPVGAQIFDVAFHPTHSTVYTGLLTGHIRAFAYDDQGNHERTFSLRPSKRSCRGLTVNNDGTHLYAVGKAKALNIIDTTTEDIEIRSAAHDSPINRVKYLMPWLLSTGDDEGVIKLWDPRQRQCTRTYAQHLDYISDFLWLDDKKQLVATSGDGTLSVMDVRSKKLQPFAQSEDQEDELLSIVAIKGTSKIVVGTQIGMLSIFNRSSGWGDCVDRIPGHPHSVDALCVLPSSIPEVDTSSTILTGSSDGLVRAVKVFPTKLMGVVTDHGEWPVERIAIGGNVSQLTLGGELSEDSAQGGSVNMTRRDVNKGDEGEENAQAKGRGRWWVGSVGHEEILRMTDLLAFFHEGCQGAGEEAHASPGDIDLDQGPVDEEVAELEEQPLAKVTRLDEDSDSQEVKKRKRRSEKKPLTAKKRGKNSVEAEGTFFDGLS